MRVAHVLCLILFLKPGEHFATTVDFRNKSLSKNDGFLNTMELANKYGYRCEEHFVETTDGYILTLHRLTGRLNGPVISKDAPTVFLLHGIFSASTSKILDGEISPGGILSDYKFDVWIGNFRGNRFSKRHKRLTTNDSEFWKFTYNEMALIDCAAFLDFILKYLDKPSLHYIGYSQSGFLMSLLLAFKPEYNQKIRSMTYLASAFILKPIKAPYAHAILRIAAPFSSSNYLLSSPVEIFPYSKTYAKLTLSFCNVDSPYFSICNYLSDSTVGIDEFNFTNKKRLKYYMAHFTNGASSNQLLHFSQCYAAGKMRLFDYGPSENLKVYKQTEVPDTNYSLIEPPKLIMYGSNDAVMTAESVTSTISLFNNVDKVVEVEGFNHMHFLYSNSMKTKVYDIVEDFIVRHNKN